ncbi:hypothetical protein ACFYNY_21445 [Streptomyces sp. NPDC006530]|uniref:hypothetical protein n=1 Tax=Streptomyces sp. NPDC006530 TaxID=3364750 RepID=UPI0036B1A3B5
MQAEVELADFARGFILPDEVIHHDVEQDVIEQPHGNEPIGRATGNRYRVMLA